MDLFLEESSAEVANRLLQRAKPRALPAPKTTLQEAIRNGKDRILYTYDVLQSGREMVKKDLIAYWTDALPKWLRERDDFDHAEAAEIQQLLRELDAADDRLDVYPLFTKCRIQAEMDRVRN